MGACVAPTRKDILCSNVPFFFHSFPPRFWQWIEHDLLERLEHDLPTPPPFFGASASSYDTMLCGQTVFFAGFVQPTARQEGRNDSAGKARMPSFDGATNAGATRVDRLTPSTGMTPWTLDALKKTSFLFFLFSFPFFLYCSLSLFVVAAAIAAAGNIQIVYSFNRIHILQERM